MQNEPGHPTGNYVIPFNLNRHLGRAQTLIDRGLLRPTAKIKIGYSNGYEGEYETFREASAVEIKINGHRLGTLEPHTDDVTNEPAPVRSEEAVWHIASFNDARVIDLQWADSASSLPLVPGEPAGTVQPKRNTLSVTLNGEWQLRIHWMTIEIDCADPVLLVHGWNSTGMDTWKDDWGLFMSDDLGLPYDRQANLGKAKTLVSNLRDIAGEVGAMQAAYGVKRITMVGHSKGGIVARAYGASHPENVGHVATIATPHRGTPALDVVFPQLAMIPFVKSLLDAQSLFLRITGAKGPGFYELSPSFLNEDMMLSQYNDKIQYVAIGGIWNWLGAANYSYPVGEKPALIGKTWSFPEKASEHWAMTSRTRGTSPKWISRVCILFA
jgi:pimeloyl-ACP methyl ester carboxylesterase